MLRPVNPYDYIGPAMYKIKKACVLYGMTFLKAVLIVLLMGQGFQVFGFEILILGVAQDAGYPQIDCEKQCCKNASGTTMVSSIAIHHDHTFWIVDATPDLPAQLAMARTHFPDSEFAGILLTHAHIGHYTGLMYLGREAMNASSIPVYCAPQMGEFLTSNGPWSQLVSTENIELRIIEPNDEFLLAEGLSVQPIPVPHRDEFSETVGYHFFSKERNALFIPDIDKWERWNQDIRKWVRRVDIALLDATFYDGAELPNRNMSEIPHPFVVESLQLFAELEEPVKQRIYFIHFNHTNPLLNDYVARLRVLEKGFMIANQGEKL